MEGIERDNTGLFEYDAQVVLPTPSFPSDHTIVSAILHIRPWSVAPWTRRASSMKSQMQAGALTVCSGEVGSPGIDGGGMVVGKRRASDNSVEDEGSSGTATPSLGRSRKTEGTSRVLRAGRRGNENTLYDYWGISELPLALTLEAATVSHASYSAARRSIVAKLTPEAANVAHAESEANSNDVTASEEVQPRVSQDRLPLPIDFDSLKARVYNRRDRQLPSLFVLYLPPLLAPSAFCLWWVRATGGIGHLNPLRRSRRVS